MSSWPRACIVAIRAEVPVPHGDLSMQPMKLFCLSQLELPVDMVTALRRWFSGDLDEPDNWEIVTPARVESSGC